MDLLKNKKSLKLLKKKFIHTKFFSERIELLLEVVPSQIVGLKKIHLKSINNSNKQKINKDTFLGFQENKIDEKISCTALPTDTFNQKTLDENSDEDQDVKNENFEDDQNNQSLFSKKMGNMVYINKNGPNKHEHFQNDVLENENENENNNEREKEKEKEKESDKTSDKNYDVHQQTNKQKKILLPTYIEFNREVLYLLENLTGISRRSLERGLSSFIERNFHLHNIRPHNKEKIIFGKASLKKNKKKEKIYLRKRKKKFRITYKKQTKTNQNSGSLKTPTKEKDQGTKKVNQTNPQNNKIAHKLKKQKTNPTQNQSQSQTQPKNTQPNQKNQNYLTYACCLSFSPPHKTPVSENNWLFEIEKKYSYEFD
ncbi:hypothetical protein M0812_23335 [Anaeramoeba flamelloides]|uniref:Uncharacterized protein n=1 Tax=Anaeramoeba flamelloides TaxID=1746091 RepID=A0AAV7YQU9_9EUKA|nr:hypothetical protein M0812_23335 [Anaeramoeba flamelloides]